MKTYIFQLIEASTGKRAPAIRGTIPSIVHGLKHADELDSDTLVLLIGYVDGEDFCFVNDHLLTIKNFCDVYATRDSHYLDLTGEQHGTSTQPV